MRRERNTWHPRIPLIRLRFSVVAILSSSLQLWRLIISRTFIFRVQQTALDSRFIAAATALENDPQELEFGTHVPRIDAFTPDQRVAAAAADEIKGYWACEEHGTCYILANSKHIQINRFRLGAWAAAVVRYYIFL